MTTHIDIKLDIIRDDSNVTKTINVTLNKHSTDTELTKTYNDENGDEQSYLYMGYVDSTITATKSMVYTIPDENQTNLIVGTEPHNHANELAYQEKYLLWWAGIKESDVFETKHTELVTGV